MNLISNGDNWYRGNLHSHSTASDGALAPDALAVMYRERGYSFLALSEHERFTARTVAGPGFLILPAIERAVYVGDGRKVYHFNGFRGSQPILAAATAPPLVHDQTVQIPDWTGPATAQNVIDELKASGNLVMLNHPVWSYNTDEDVAALAGYFAIEIYNHGCVVENDSGLATAHWDALLRAGRRVWGVATDDNHNRNRYHEAPPEWDSFGGWVMVGADSLSHDAICDALVAGRFYSSAGPTIRDLTVDGGEVTVECSPVERIHFITGERRGYSRCDSNGRELTTATYRLSGDELYVRVECIDGRGRRAWTNPVFLRQDSDPVAQDR